MNTRAASRYLKLLDMKTIRIPTLIYLKKKLSSFKMHTTENQISEHLQCEIPRYVQVPVTM